MATEYPIAILISGLDNGITVSTNYTGAVFNTRVIDGIDNTLDEILGDASLADALRTHADMLDRYM